MLIEYDGSNVVVLEDFDTKKSLVILQKIDGKLVLYLMPLWKLDDILDKTDFLEEKYEVFDHRALADMDSYLEELYMAGSLLKKIRPSCLVHTTYKDNIFDGIERVFFIGVEEKNGKKLATVK